MIQDTETKVFLLIFTSPSLSYLSSMTDYLVRVVDMRNGRRTSTPNAKCSTKLPFS